MHTTPHTGNAPIPPAVDTLEFLVFMIGEKEYGIDLARVLELRSHTPVTPMPGSPAIIKGTIDLLGARIQVVDMRLALGTALPAQKEFGDVVIVNVAGHVVAAAVDTVMDVVTLNASQIAQPPPPGAPLHAGCQIGVGILNERRLILIDIDDFMHGAISQPGLRAA